MTSRGSLELRRTRVSHRGALIHVFPPHPAPLLEDLKGFLSRQHSMTVFLSACGEAGSSFRTTHVKSYMRVFSIHHAVNDDGLQVFF